MKKENEDYLRKLAFEIYEKYGDFSMIVVDSKFTFFCAGEI